jgi:uncharacterized protein
MADNPFRYGGVVRDAYFADREDELATLRGAIRSGQNVVVVSPRRYGKTSLVERAIALARRDGALVAYVDLLRTPTKDRLADALAQAIYDGLVSRVERAAQKARSFFTHLRVTPKVVIDERGRVSVEFSAFERQEDVDAVLIGLLELPGRIAGERERRVALVLDEFQEIVAIDRALTGVMRSVFQQQDHVAHIFLGSRRHLMDELFHDKTAHLYRSARALPLGPIPREKFARWIRRRFASSGVEIADDTLGAVLDLTGGRPFETQELCSFVWEQARGDGTIATVNALERALDRLLEAETPRYVAIWDSLSQHQRAVLASIAADGRAVYSEQYRLRHKLGGAGSVQTSLRALETKELVERSNGDWIVSDAFVGEWLRRTIRP